MYLRRKVFSSYIDEYGEERYFSAETALSGLELMRKASGYAPLTEQQKQAYLDSAAEQASAAGKSGAAANAGAAAGKSGAAANAGAKAEGAAKDGFVKRGKAWLKKTYGKGAEHRGRNIAITAAVPVAAAGIGLGVKAARSKRSRNNDNE